MHKTKEQRVIYSFPSLPTIIGEYNEINKIEDCNYSNKTSSRRCVLKKKTPVKYYTRSTVRRLNIMHHNYPSFLKFSTLSEKKNLKRILASSFRKAYP